MSERVNLNKASYDELLKLSMVGDTRAKDIIDHRPYKTWDELKEKCPSVSDGMVDDIKKSGATLE